MIIPGASDARRARRLRELAPLANASLQTLHRWRLTGLRGGRAKLAAVRIGARLYSSEAALTAFIAASTAQPDDTAGPPDPGPAEDRSRRVAVSQRLDEVLGTHP